MTRSISSSFIALLVVSYSTSAWAHIELTNPPARYGLDFQKDGPCGMAGNPPGTNPPTELTAGEPLMVAWDEFVDHGGHFRISISNEGDDAFLNPTGFEDFYNSPTVILDDIMDDGQQFHMAEIVVPDIPCNPCSLQLIQVMAGGQFSEDSLYYQCADIVINPGAAETTGGEDESSGGPTDESTGGAESSSSDDGASMSATGASATTTATSDDATDSSVDPSLGTGESTGTGDSNDDGDGGCGCTTREPTPFAWLAVAGLAAFRRRRR